MFSQRIEDFFISALPKFQLQILQPMRDFKIILQFYKISFAIPLKIIVIMKCISLENIFFNSTSQHP